MGEETVFVVIAPQGEVFVFRSREFWITTYVQNTRVVLSPEAIEQARKAASDRLDTMMCSEMDATRIKRVYGVQSIKDVPDRELRLFSGIFETFLSTFLKHLRNKEG
jgi:hypothetical protein